MSEILAEMLARRSRPPIDMTDGLHAARTARQIVHSSLCRRCSPTEPRNPNLEAKPPKLKSAKPRRVDGVPGDGDSQDGNSVDRHSQTGPVPADWQATLQRAFATEACPQQKRPDRVMPSVAA
ncbi:hypothetical protein [Blastochloris tepida]|uniref:hypothetical protein n=1 Tax=Blastochloris tepida TaxID=2233851 RepID=UPI000F816667|nr:hypothetical protein [Blastochloris tepida]